MHPVFSKGPIELSRPRLPQPFHRGLTFGIEFQPGGALIKGGNKSRHDLVNVGIMEHAHTGLHEQILVKQKHLRADS